MVSWFSWYMEHNFWCMVTWSILLCLVFHVCILHSYYRSSAYGTALQISQSGNVMYTRDLHTSLGCSPPINKPHPKLTSDELTLQLFMNRWSLVQHGAAFTSIIISDTIKYKSTAGISLPQPIIIIMVVIIMIIDITFNIIISIINIILIVFIIMVHWSDAVS